MIKIRGCEIRIMNDNGHEHKGRPLAPFIHKHVEHVGVMIKDKAFRND